ncbi:MAG: CHASE domain-containing protein [Gammaproteobacteria bacterium]|nr:CHASE domain-containing protein [Gammaproteobacteria bacterium]
MLSLKWAPRVTEAQRPAFEAAARAAGLASFRITERDAQGRLVLAGRRAEYFPVYYAEPLAGNELTLGFDIASGPVRRAALEQARDSGTTVTTEHITLLQMPEEVEGGFLVLSPIYRGGTDRPPDVAARRTGLLGFAGATLRINVLLRDALPELGERLDLTLYDAPAVDGCVPLTATGAAALPANSQPLCIPIQLPGQRWTAVFSPTPAFHLLHRHWQAWQALAWGLSLTIVLVVALFNLGRRAARLEALAQELAASNTALSAEQRLLEAAHRDWVQTFDAIRDPIFLHDPAGRLLRVNRAYAREAGGEIRDLLGRPYWEVFPQGEGPTPGCRMNMETPGVDGELCNREDIPLPDGRIFSTHYSILNDAQGNYLYSVHLMEDATERRRAEAREKQLMHERGERLKELECLYQASRLAAAPELQLAAALERLVRLIPRAFQYPAITAVRLTVGEDVHATPDFRDTPWGLTAPVVVNGEKVGRLEVRYREERSPRDVGPFYKEEKTLLGALAHQVGILAERAAREQALRRAQSALTSLSRSNRALVRATDEQLLLQEVCTILVEEGGYQLAWVGYAGTDPDKTLRPMAWAGAGGDFLTDMEFSWGTGEQGQCPSGRAVREGRPQVVRDVAAEPAYAAWQELLSRHQIQGAAAFPLLAADRSFGALVVYAGSTAFFDDAEVALLDELADDLSYGIRMLRIKAEHGELRGELETALLQTIKAIGRTVEKRDPYTAGHQVRVAELAVAIATELGLTADQIEGIRIGAVIHDIGKIYIPSEILNRPGRLSRDEFGLIKSHPQVGYDIIRDVSFPWPVADMILQHHERLDGFGYPQGLQGSAIILEARILAVADVVEAMTSHRPYRPGLGIDQALAEIERGRSSQYDAEVVDACLRLFRDQGFRWRETADPDAGP